MADQPDPTAELQFVQSDLTETASTCPESHQCFLVDLGNLGGQGKEALEDGDLNMESKARVLQMVMQCSLPPTGPATFYRENRGTVGGLVAKLKNIRQQTQRCTFEERMTLALLAQTYQVMVEEAKTQMLQDRSIRRRQAKNESLEPKRRQNATTTALKELAKQQTLMEISELKASIDEGVTLLFLGRELGYHILASFPCAVVRPHEFVVSFETARSCFKSLSKPISPTEYVYIRLDMEKAYPVCKGITVSRRPSVSILQSGVVFSARTYSISLTTPKWSPGHWPPLLPPATRR